ncbi:hypothetical protein CF392_15995, partial [Tamilnaduibacter salinus]
MTRKHHDRKKLITAIALAGSAALLAGCNGGDDVNVDLGGSGSGGTGGGSGSGSASAPDNCPSWTTPAVTQGLGVCQIRDDITQDRTLTSDITWQFVGQIQVGDGNEQLDAKSDATDVSLTIEPGTDLRSDVGGYLVVTRGATLNAAGTESNPITFSSVDEGIDGSGEWGGLVVQGFAPTNQEDGPGGYVNVDAEAGLGFYSGDDAADNSGTIQYVRIAEGGFEIAPGEEINGLTLFAVGTGTTINNVQVHGNQDDGIEFFGGTARVKHLVLTENLTIASTWDLGYQGNVQYALVTKVGESGRGMETDNDGSSVDNTPRSRPTLANVTIVGASGADASAYHREGTGGFIHNSIFSGDDTCINVESGTEANHPAELFYDNVVIGCAQQGGSDYAGGISAAADIEANEGISAADPMIDTNTYKPSAEGTASGNTNSLETVQSNNAGNTCGAGGNNSCATAVDSFIDSAGLSYRGAVDPNASAPFW